MLGFIFKPTTMFNITAFVCIDETKEDSRVKYSQLTSLSGNQRRELYWKCAYTFFCASKKVNPDKPHILFTNDTREVNIKGIDIKSQLKEKGVTIRELRFAQFNPGGATKFFKNAFFRFEVFKVLGEESLPSIVLDTDCLWVQKDPQLERLIGGKHLLLYDVYQRSHTPEAKGPHNLSMKDMGEAFRKVDPAYPTQHPVWYGGECIAASPDNFKMISDDIHKLFNQLLERSKRHNLPSYSNGKSLLNGDEVLSSFVFNSGKYETKHINGFLKRVWTYPDINNVKKDDLKLAIWHLIGEKTTGINLLFKEAINPASAFWTVPVSQFNYYVGEFCGIPKRVHGKYQPFLIKRQIKGKLKKLIGR